LDAAGNLNDARRAMKAVDRAADMGKLPSTGLANRVPVTFLDPSVMKGVGSTNRIGDVFVRSDLSPVDFVETLRHEAVHRWLSPLYGPLSLRIARGNLKFAGYKHSHVLKALEEGVAELYGTRDLRATWDFIKRLPRDYQVSWGRVAGETCAAGATVGAAASGASAISGSP